MAFTRGKDKWIIFHEEILFVTFTWGDATYILLALCFPRTFDQESAEKETAHNCVGLSLHRRDPRSQLQQRYFCPPTRRSL